MKPAQVEHYMRFFGRGPGGVPVQFEFATIGHVSTFSGQWVEGRIKQILSRNELYSPGRVRGPASYVTGGLVLANSDGALDYLRDYSFDGSNMGIWQLDPVTFAQIPVQAMQGQQPIFSEQEVTIATRDQRYLMEKTLLSRKYAGTNAGSPLAGIEGTAGDLQGHPKPQLFGTCLNVSPKLVNTAKLIYQVTSMAQSAGVPLAVRNAGGFNTGFTITVYDKRSPLTRAADYVSQADMEANAPAAGQYRVWPAGGCFRLGSAPVGIVTCDASNPSNNVSGGGTSSKASAVLKDLSYFSNVEMNPQSYLSGDYDVGAYFDAELTVLDALGVLLAGYEAFFTLGPDPTQFATQFGIGWYSQLSLLTNMPYWQSLPKGGGGAGAFTFDEGNDRSLNYAQSQEDNRGMPIWRVNLRYARNYTVMSDTDLAGVAMADREFCKQEWRVVTAEDASVKNQWPEAQELTVDSQVLQQADAQALANRLLLLFKVRRDLFELQMAGADLREQLTLDGTTYPASLQPGVLCRVTWPRFGLSGGKDCMVTSITRDYAADEYTLTVWG